MKDQKCNDDMRRCSILTIQIPIPRSPPTCAHPTPNQVWASIVSTIIFCQSDEIKFPLPHSYICITVRRSKMSSSHLESAQANLPLPPSHQTHIHQPPTSPSPSPSPPHPAPPPTRRKNSPVPFGTNQPHDPNHRHHTARTAIPSPHPAPRHHTLGGRHAEMALETRATAPAERALGSGKPARWSREGGFGRGCGGGWWEW